MEDRGTYLTTAGGLIAVVALGTGLASFMEGRANHSKTKHEVSTHLVEDKQTVETLRRKVDEVRAKWVKAADFKRVGAACEAGKKAEAERVARTAALVSKKAELAAALASQEAAFVKYRADYRISSWHSAVGDSVGTLRTTDGREYRDVTISRVTEDGIQIRHEHGIARISSAHLGDAWHKRFQWTGTEVLSKAD
jgi:hypothetical protein